MSRTLCARRPQIDIATAAAPIRSLAEFLDPSCVKALRALDGQALYFSRAAVPWPRDAVSSGRPTRFAGAWRHIGIYAYRVRSLLQFASWPPTPLEECEKLEQLRALEHGMRIHLVALSEVAARGCRHAGGSGARARRPDARRVTIRVLFVCLGNICRSPDGRGSIAASSAARSARIAGRGRFGGNGRLSHRRSARPAQPARGYAARHRPERLARASSHARRFCAFRSHSRDGSRQPGPAQSVRPAHSRAQLRLFLEYAADTRAASRCPIPTMAAPAASKKCWISPSAASRGLIVGSTRSGVAASTASRRARSTPAASAPRPSDRLRTVDHCRPGIDSPPSFPPRPRTRRGWC